MAKELWKAVGYIRTSSLTNIGFDKDSEDRQRSMIAECAKHFEYQIASTFADPGISGCDLVDNRPGFKSLVEFCISEGIKTIIFEDASRFSRDLINQEIGFKQLTASGFKLISAANPTQFLDEGPTSKLIRQVLGAVSEFEKSNLVAKLKGARQRAAERKGLKTLKGSFQSSGPRSRIQGEDGQKIVKALRPFAKKSKLKRGEMKQAASACFKAGIKDAKGNACNHKTIKGWLNSVKRGVLSTSKNGGGSQEPPRSKPGRSTPAQVFQHIKERGRFSRTGPKP